MKLLLPFTLGASWLAAHSSMGQTITTSTRALTYFPVDSLIGKWHGGATEYDEQKHISKNTISGTLVRVACNVCPEVSFRTDSTVTLRPESSTETPQVDYLWSIRGTTLIIRQLPGLSREHAYLPAGRYTARIRKSLSLQKLVLTDSKGMRYILNRLDK